MTDTTKAALDSVRQLVRDRRFDIACDVLREARNVARDQANRDDELFLTSMLVSHLSIAGDDQAAVEECLSAEAANPEDQSLQLLAIRQLLRTGLRNDAAVRCERLLAATGSLNSETRHVLISSLGECAVENDPALAQRLLKDAMNVAITARLEPSSWNRSLAIQLWQRGDVVGEKYLYMLRSAAEGANDRATVIEIDALLGVAAQNR